jgi:hypothetical protein
MILGSRGVNWLMGHVVVALVSVLEDGLVKSTQVTKKKIMPKRGRHTC